MRRTQTLRREGGLQGSPNALCRDPWELKSPVGACYRNDPMDEGPLGVRHAPRLLFGLVPRFGNG